MRLSLRPGEVTPTMTGRTLPLGTASSDAAAVRALTTERYGLSLADVDAHLAERQGLPTEANPDPAHLDATNLGKRRRQS